MSESTEIQKMLFSDGEEEYEIFIATKNIAVAESEEDDSESDGRSGRGNAARDKVGQVTRISKEQMAKTTRMIRGFALYTVNAFRQFGAAKVEEVNFSFGLTLGGKAGIPYITEGSAESNVTISVKCTFPDEQQPPKKENKKDNSSPSSPNEPIKPLGFPLRLPFSQLDTPLRHQKTVCLDFGSHSLPE